MCELMVLELELEERPVGAARELKQILTFCITRLFSL